MIRRLADAFERMAAERPVFLAFLVFLTAAAIIIPLSFPFYFVYPTEFLVNILSEAHGMVFDLLIIGWFLFWLNKLAERRLNNNRYREEIEDYLGWSSPEATHRIAGNIRRLNRGGVKSDIRLTHAHLRGANLAGAHLRNSDLWGADLEGANLDGADLREVNLAGAHMESADMERVMLAGSDLRGANLIEADIERGDLSRVDMRGAILRGADLQYTLLNDAQLERINLEGANLRGATMERANLRRASLRGANLRGAHLEGSDLRDASFEDADLGGAFLYDAKLPEDEAVLIAMFRVARNLLGTHFDARVQRVLEDTLPALSGTTVQDVGLEENGAAGSEAQKLEAARQAIQSSISPA